MNLIEEIAITNLRLDAKKLSLCGGEHGVCLECVFCRSGFADQTIEKVTQLEHLIDHTILVPNTTTNQITNLCSEAISYNFKAVCINPTFVNHCTKELQKSETLVCTVIGFPLGANNTVTKTFETEYCIQQGAREIDMVINLSFLKDKKIELFYDDIASVAAICSQNNISLKVIIETCLLSNEEIILASLVAKRGGASFVKTSTGFSNSGARVEDVKLIRNAIGPKMGVKASGGIRTALDAIAMIKAGANRLGTSRSVEIINEFKNTRV